MSAFTHDPLRHPWFSTASLKRKHSESSDEDDSPPGRPHAVMLSPSSSYDNLRGGGDMNVGAGPSILPTPPPEQIGMMQERWHASSEVGHEKKRRRCEMIERQMAGLQLHQNAAQVEGAGMVEGAQPYNSTYSHLSAPPLYQTFSSSSTASNESIAPGYPYVSISPMIDSDSILYDQYAVEEPPSPQFGKPIPLPHPADPKIQEVRMKGTEPAWFEREKDRIVITDLEEVIAQVEAEEEAAKKHRAVDEEEYKSEAEPYFAECANSNTNYSASSVLLDRLFRGSSQHPKASEGALVLYRPPLITSLPPGFGRVEEMISGPTGGEAAVGYGGYGDEYDMPSAPDVESDMFQDDDAMDIEL